MRTILMWAVFGLVFAGGVELQPETLQTPEGQSIAEPTCFDRLRVVTGGQAGVDRAALDVAKEMGLPVGGWCPKGRLAEDGPIATRYPLQECGSPLPKVRTELNVIDSDGTLVLNLGKPKDGTPLTVTLAKKHKRPVLVIELDDESIDVAAFRRWIADNKIKTLNIGGPRETHRAGYVYKRASEVLKLLLTR